MKEGTLWALAIASFHLWALLVFTDAQINRCVAAFAVAVAWGIAAAVKTVVRMDAKR